MAVIVEVIVEVIVAVIVVVAIQAVTLATLIEIVSIVEEVTVKKTVTRMVGTAVIGGTVEAQLLQGEAGTPLSIGVAGATPEALLEGAVRHAVEAQGVLGTMMSQPLMLLHLLLMPLAGKGMGHAWL